MSELYIGNVQIGKEPKIVSVISGKDAPELALKSKCYGADLLELRFDLYKELYSHKDCAGRIKQYIEAIKTKSQLPVIATIRRFEELGNYGNYSESEDQRLDLFRLLLDHVDCVDIELNSEKIRDYVIKEAKDKEKKVIVSHHNNQRSFRLDELVKLTQKITSTGADIGKICILARNRNDVQTLLALTLHEHKIPFATISLGWIGKSSRYIFPFFGSCLTYGYVDKPVVPEQFHIEELRRYLDDHNPASIEALVNSKVDSFREKDLTELLQV